MAAEALFSRKQRVRTAIAAAFARRPLDAVGLRVARLNGSPTMHQLSQIGHLVSTADEVMSLVGLESASGDGALIEEARARLDARAAHAVRPAFMQVEEQTERLLVAAVRSLRPDVVLEIGVADGRSSELLLSALRANGHGRLVSVDIDADVGALVTDRSGWDLRIHAPGEADRKLVELLDELGTLSLVFHDGRHDYAGQMRDYQAIAPHVAPNGLLVSDDVDHSYAFIDLCSALEVRPAVMNVVRKAVGAVRLNP